MSLVKAGGKWLADAAGHANAHWVPISDGFITECYFSRIILLKIHLYAE